MRCARPSTAPGSAARRRACCSCRRTSPTGSIDMLVGAIEALDVGDPFDYATDIGPVIDEDAQDALDGHKIRMQREGARARRPAAAGKLPRRQLRHAGASTRSTASSILEREVFGPILHVVRYERGHLDKVVAAINATGYGLTLGLHSRIEAVADYVAEHARVGNIYVNRNQIGAVVGVQPFGGEGLSGTGPKAGGPNYAARLRHRARALDRHHRDRRQLHVAQREVIALLWRWRLAFPRAGRQRRSFSLMLATALCAAGRKDTITRKTRKISWRPQRFPTCR